MLKHLFTAKRRRPAPRDVRPTVDPMPRIRWYSWPERQQRAGARAMAVRPVAFDVFGTLVDWRSGVADAFPASGVSGDPYELADAWRARYPPILAEVNAD